MAVEPPVALRRDEGAEPERVTGADGRAAGRPAGEAGRPSPFGGGAYVVPLCDGGAVVVDAETLAGAILNEVGAFVLERARSGVTGLEPLVEAVEAAFDAPREAIREDVARFLRELAALQEREAKR